MKTVITEKIDGLEIISGFYHPIMDPAATRIQTESKMNKDPIMKEKSDLVADRDSIMKKIAPLIQALMSYDQKGEMDSPGAVKIIQKLQNLDAEMKIIIDKIHTLIPRITDRYKEVKEENTVYFEPKAGEYIIKDEEKTELMKKLGSIHGTKAAITRDGKEVPDYRGYKFWIKTDNDWNRGMVIKINKIPPSGHKAFNDITAEDRKEIMVQAELERLHKLTPEQREIEKQTKRIQALAIAAAKKSQMEVEENPDALKKSQTWLKDEQARIEARYNI